MDLFTLPPLADRAARVLVAMGDDAQRARVVEALGAEGHAVSETGLLEGLLDQVRFTLPDLVLMDLEMPDGSALEALGDLRMVDTLRLMPVGLLAERSLGEDVVAVCLLAGADDVLDPTRLCELTARVAVQLRNRRDRDLLRRAQKERIRLIDDAYTDPLTGVGNRRAADLALGAPLDDDTSALLMVIDIDHFKRVNDTYGHAAGDEVLRAIGHCLNRLSRDGDTIARFGGEEFLVLIRDAPAASHRTIAERFLAGVRTMRLRPHVGPARVTVSIGAVSLPPLGSEEGIGPTRPATLAPLFEVADQGLYQAKRSGRDALVIVSHGELVHADAQLSIYPENAS